MLKALRKANRAAEAALIEDELHEAAGNVSKASQRLGVARTTLLDIIQRTPALRGLERLSRGRVKR